MPEPRARTAESLQIPPEIEEEIQRFEDKVEQLRRGEIDPDAFRAFRLQHGVYGQRQEGVQMVRVKIPFGGLNGDQLDCLADIADDFSTGRGHITTRQNMQLHFVSLDDAATVMRRLVAAGLTTREACGNTVRNVTGCARAGVCPEEVFDITPLARATFKHFIRNPVCQDMPRKFKISFSGCPTDCGLAPMHDVGLVATSRSHNGSVEYGFRVFAGGGLGPSPKAAQLLYEFLPFDQLLPTIEAMLRVFELEGERKSRNKARIKFVVERLGVDEFRRLVEIERAGLPAREEINLDEMRVVETPPEHAPIAPALDGRDQEAFQRWRATNVLPQKQAGYCIVYVRLVLGDITSSQMRALAQIVRDFSGDNLRTSVQQNLVLRWVPEESIPALYDALAEIGLAEPGAERLIDVTACPGADTCNLAFTSSRGLARAITEKLSQREAEFQDIRDVRIKISGCPNSCGQHQIAAIGFHGGSHRKDGKPAPFYQLHLGGRISNQDGITFGANVVKIPAKQVPDVTFKLLEFYQQNRRDGESFVDFYDGLDRERVKALLEPYSAIGNFEEEPDSYYDWGAEQEFDLKDLGLGECAGVVLEEISTILSESQAMLEKAERFLAAGRYSDGVYTAFTAQVSSAKALLAIRGVDPRTHKQTIEEFEKQFVDNGPVSEKFFHFKQRVNKFRSKEPDEKLAREYIESAREFIVECQEVYQASLQGAKA